MARHYSGEYTPSRGPFRGVTFPSQRQYRNALEVSRAEGAYPSLSARQRAARAAGKPKAKGLYVKGRKQSLLGRPATRLPDVGQRLPANVALVIGTGDNQMTLVRPGERLERADQWVFEMSPATCTLVGMVATVDTWLRSQGMPGVLRWISPVEASSMGFLAQSAIDADSCATEAPAYVQFDWDRYEEVMREHAHYEYYG